MHYHYWHIMYLSTSWFSFTKVFYLRGINDSFIHLFINFLFFFYIFDRKNVKMQKKTILTSKGCQSTLLLVDIHQPKCLKMKNPKSKINLFSLQGVPQILLLMLRGSTRKCYLAKGSLDKKDWETLYYGESLTQLCLEQLPKYEPNCWF